MIESRQNMMKKEHDDKENDGEKEEKDKDKGGRRNKMWKMI